MKKIYLPALCLLSALTILSAPAPASAKTDFNVNVNLGTPPVVVESPPPRIIVDQPPEMVVIPRSTVYFAPGLSVDLFFNNGWWWTRDHDRWYRSHEYRGPWGFVPQPRVPREFREMRPDYRNFYGREGHIPYGQLKKHWRDREIDRREHRGEWRDWKEDKRDRKEFKKEMKREMKEDRKGNKGKGRGDDQGDRGDDRGGHGHGRD
jgi:hypothetical protein